MSRIQAAFVVVWASIRIGLVAARKVVLFGIGILPLVVAGMVVWHVWTAPPLTAKEKAAEAAYNLAIQKADQQEYGRQLYLCHLAAACKEYDAVRLDCATAGSFKMCMQIKMGSDADFIDACSGYDEGAPAIALPSDTPNRVACFFRTLFK